MSRRDKEEEPEDELDKEMGRTVKFERALTKIEQKRFERKIIDSKLKQLEGYKKELERTFLSGSSVSETEQIARELPANKFNLFMVLGYFVDHSKKLKPEEFRKELLALVRMIPLANPSDRDKDFLAGFKTAGDLLEALQAAGLGGRPGLKSSESKDFSEKPAEAARTSQVPTPRLTHDYCL